MASLRTIFPVLAALALAMPSSALASGTSGATTSAALQTKSARYSFDGAGVGLLMMSGSMKVVPGAVFATTAMAVTGSGATVFFPTVIDFTTNGGVRTYGGLGSHQLCQAPLTCHLSGGVFTFGLVFTVTAGRPIHLRQYFSVRGADVVFHDKILYGFKARHRNGGLTRLTDADVTSTGADVVGNDVSVVMSAKATGSPHGSVAIDVPGCDTVGAGISTLAGGEQSAKALCPAGPFGAYSRSGTTWTVSGPSVGVSPEVTRLLVIDA